MGPGPDPAPSVTQVVVISLDGLNPTALTRLGKRGTPVLHRMMRRGASTLNARTAYEMTVTLPNHTSMVTGRRIAAADGGHGVTWNDDRLTPRTVQAAAGGPVESVFNVVHDAGRQTALFASKTKFSLWQRSWPLALDQYAVDLDNRRLTNAGPPRRARQRPRPHVRAPVRHRRGRPRPGLDDAGLPDRGTEGRHLRRPDPRRHRPAGETAETMVVVTSDHGGIGRDHGDATAYADYRIPFLVLGPDVPRGADLYDLNPAYRDPRQAPPDLRRTRQPIRNGAVANLVTDVLGLPAVPASQVDALQDLDVFPAP